MEKYNKVPENTIPWAYLEEIVKNPSRTKFAWYTEEGRLTVVEIERSDIASGNFAAKFFTMVKTDE